MKKQVIIIALASLIMMTIFYLKKQVRCLLLRKLSTSILTAGDVISLLSSVPQVSGFALLTISRQTQ